MTALDEYLPIAALLYINWKDHAKVEKKILLQMGHDRKSFATLEGEAIRSMKADNQKEMTWGEFTVELREDLPHSPEALKYSLKPKPMILLHKNK